VARSDIRELPTGATALMKASVTVWVVRLPPLQQGFLPLCPWLSSSQRDSGESAAADNLPVPGSASQPVNEQISPLRGGHNAKPAWREAAADCRGRAAAGGQIRPCGPSNRESDSGLSPQPSDQRLIPVFPEVDFFFACWPTGCTAIPRPILDREPLGFSFCSDPPGSGPQQSAVGQHRHHRPARTSALARRTRRRKMVLFQPREASSP